MVTSAHAMHPMHELLPHIVANADTDLFDELVNYSKVDDLQLTLDSVVCCAASCCSFSSLTTPRSRICLSLFTRRRCFRRRNRF